MSGMEQLYQSIRHKNSREHVESAIHNYVNSFAEHDLEKRGALFANNATFSDPANSPAFSGLDAIHQFWLGLKAAPFRMEPTINQIVVCGDSVILDFIMKMTSKVDVRTLHVRDIFEFNDQGKIQSLMAYWDPACLTQSQTK